jgi:transposase InsO family protein
MPWMERDAMSLRKEFVELANLPGANVSRLARRFSISRTSAYKWLRRAEADPVEGLREQSRRPDLSPSRTAREVEQRVVALRDQFHWGGRKLSAVLKREGWADVPAPSTITAILHRHQRITPQDSEQREHYVRFERPEPNDTWQMDFKGHFPLRSGRCHALTVLDDHSRYALAIRALGDERFGSVQDSLIALFRRYGLPWTILCDNGPPWGNQSPDRHTHLTAWWMRLGIQPLHGRPKHPQTQGKDERFHRTLDEEVLRWQRPDTMARCQTCFDDWREVYNHHRPHEALHLEVPASRYRPSSRDYPEVLPALEYPSGTVRKVDGFGCISFKGRNRRVGKAFTGSPVTVRDTSIEGCYDVYFSTFVVKRIDVRVQDDDE